MLSSTNQRHLSLSILSWCQELILQTKDHLYDCRIFTSDIKKLHHTMYRSKVLLQGVAHRGSDPFIDILIVGGGPVGSSTAYHLSKLRNNNGNGITVLESDPTYQSSSAMYSAGGIRQQFSLEENIRMSLYGRDFLRRAHKTLKSQAVPDVDVQFQEHGYLFLTSSESGVLQMTENHQTQRQAGCTTTRLLSPDQLKEKFPWLNTEDLLLGSFGTTGEGWFDPWAYIQGLKEKNKEMGVKYLHSTVAGSKRDLETKRILSVDIQEPNSRTIQTVFVNQMVNATGAKANALMTMLAGGGIDELRYPLPVKPRKRCIFFFQS